MNKKGNENILKVDFIFGIIIFIAIAIIGYIFFDDLKSFFVSQSEQGNVLGSAFFIKILTSGAVIVLGFMAFLYAKLKEKRQEQYMKGFALISLIGTAFFTISLTFSQLLFYLFDTIDFDVIVFSIILVNIFAFFITMTSSLIQFADFLRKNIDVLKWSGKGILSKNLPLFVICIILLNALCLVGNRDLYREMMMLDIGFLLAFFSGVMLPMRLAKIFSKFLS